MNKTTSIYFKKLFDCFTRLETPPRWAPTKLKFYPRDSIGWSLNRMEKLLAPGNKKTRKVDGGRITPRLSFPITESSYLPINGDYGASLSLFIYNSITARFANYSDLQWTMATAIKTSSLCATATASTILILSGLPKPIDLGILLL